MKGKPEWISRAPGGRAEAPCDQEELVAAAVRRGRVPPELQAHVAVCGSCRDVHEAATMMVELADRTERLAERRRLPEAGQLWWKAQLARRWEAEHQVVAPLDLMQRAEVAVGGIAALVLLVLLIRSLTGLTLVPQELWFPLSDLAVKPVALVAGFLLAAGVTIGLTLQWLLAAE
jgi:hypothetical protein